MARRPASDCLSMADLRAAIDTLDSELFDLFAERMAYIHQAAVLKRGTDIPADVPERVEEVVRNAQARADAHGLDSELYGRFWREIVAAAIAEEERRLAQPG